MYVFKDGDVTRGRSLPIKVWAKEGEIEEGALDQIGNVAFIPMAYHHVAGMPDMHWGYGMPIGGVVALSGAISPNMVGVDIGCGMRSIKTSLTEINLEDVKNHSST